MATIKTASGKTFKVAKGVDGKPRVTPAKWAKGEIKQMQGLISSIHLTQRPLGGGPRAEEEFGDRFRTVRTLSDRKWVESTLEGNAAEARRRADEDEKTATHYRMTFPTQTDVQERFARSAAENRKGAEETERLLSKVRAHGLPVEVRAYDPTLPERDRAARVAEASAGKWQPPDEREALRKVARWEREGASAKISRTREQRQWRDGGDFDYERHQRSMADVAKRMRESGRYSEEQIAARMKAFPHMFDYRNAAVLAHVVSQQAAIGQSIGEFVAGGAKWRPVASIGRADYQERVEGRKERLEARAESAMAEADRRRTEVRRIQERIPLGQPLLIGHHSERGHRADMKRIDTGMRKSVEAYSEARRLERAADSVGKGGISSDDPEAVAKLKREAAQYEQAHERMKAANAAIRKHKGDRAAQISAMKTIGISEDRAAKLLEPDFAGRIGFADYAIKNNNANIRRIKERIASLEKEGERRAVTPAASGTFKGGSWEERPDINRVAVTFDGKPDEATRAKLKGLGFRWSPTEGAWVTGLDNRGRYRAKEVERMMGGAEAPSPAPTGPTHESAAAERAAASAAVQGASDKTARMKAGLAAMMLAAQQGQVGAAIGEAMAAAKENGSVAPRRLAAWEMTREEFTAGARESLDRWRKSFDADMHTRRVDDGTIGGAVKMDYRARSDHEAGIKAGQERVAEAEATHERAIRRALAEGKPVPTHVLAAYPDIAKKAKPPSIFPGAASRFAKGFAPVALAQTGAPQVTKTDARKVESLAARNDKLKALPPGVAESVRKYLKAGFAPHKAMARALVENVKVQRGPRGGLFYMTEGGHKKYIRRGTAMSAAVDRSKVG